MDADETCLDQTKHRMVSKSQSVWKTASKLDFTEADNFLQFLTNKVFHSTAT